MTTTSKDNKLPTEIWDLLYERVFNEFCDANADPVASIVDAIAPIVNGWYRDAERNAAGVAYYQDLLDKCGRSIGEKAYVCDDGSVSKDVLRAKIPELVAELVRDKRRKSKELESYSQDPGIGWENSI